MRDIKFRAWDKENKKMFKVARFDFSDYTIYSHLFSCDGFLGENCEIMQYTGLKDKDGVEIYEGDIVDYFKGEFAVIEKRVRGYVISSKNYEDDFWHISGKMKVIGNIYKNPELL